MVSARRQYRKSSDLREFRGLTCDFDVRLDAGQIDNDVVESAVELFCKFLACLVASVGAVSVACSEADVVDYQLHPKLLDCSMNVVGHSFVEVIVVEARCVERVGDSMSQHCFSAHVDCCVVHIRKYL